MSYEFQSTLHRSTGAALAHVAEAWIFGGGSHPYPSTLAADPAKMAHECVHDGFGLVETFAEWGVSVDDLAEAIRAAVAMYRADCAEE